MKSIPKAKAANPSENCVILRVDGSHIKVDDKDPAINDTEPPNKSTADETAKFICNSSGCVVTNLWKARNPLPA